MNWRLIGIFAIALFMLPTVVGFIFGATNILWQGFLSAEVAFWIRQVCIGIGVFWLFLSLARRARTLQLWHIFAAFAVAELAVWILILATDGPIASTLIWSAVTAVLAASAYLLSRRTLQAESAA